MIKNNINSFLIVIASSNAGKIKEFQRFLYDLPIKIDVMPKGIEIEETGKTFRENARIKALAVAKLTGNFALADDSGLQVEALGGAPGVHSARYGINDSERILRLLRELQCKTNRSASFISSLCIASPQGEVLLEVEGSCDGFITKKPRGERGFGYDPIFEADGIGLTFAEMSIDQKQKIGHRGIALSLLKPALKELLNFYE